MPPIPKMYHFLLYLSFLFSICCRFFSQTTAAQGAMRSQQLVQLLVRLGFSPACPAVCAHFCSSTLSLSFLFLSFSLFFFFFSSLCLHACRKKLRQAQVIFFPLSELCRICSPLCSPLLLRSCAATRRARSCFFFFSVLLFLFLCFSLSFLKKSSFCPC